MSCSLSRLCISWMYAVVASIVQSTPSLTRSFWTNLVNRGSWRLFISAEISSTRCTRTLGIHRDSGYKFRIRNLNKYVSNASRTPLKYKFSGMFAVCLKLSNLLRAASRSGATRWNANIHTMASISVFTRFPLKGVMSCWFTLSRLSMRRSSADFEPIRYRNVALRMPISSINWKGSALISAFTFNSEEVRFGGCKSVNSAFARISTIVCWSIWLFVFCVTCSSTWSFR